MFAGQPLQFWLIIFVLPMLATIPVTALICRYRTSRKKRVSYGTVTAGACTIPFAMFSFFTVMILVTFGLDDGKAPSPLLFLQLFGFVACVCILPALGVVGYYQRRNKKDETRVA